MEVQEVGPAHPHSLLREVTLSLIVYIFTCFKKNSMESCRLNKNPRKITYVLKKVTISIDKLIKNLILHKAKEKVRLIASFTLGDLSVPTTGKVAAIGNIHYHILLSTFTLC